MFCRTLSGTAEEETKIPGAAGSCKPKPDRSARRRPMKMPAFWRKGRGTKKQTLADQPERERLTVSRQFLHTSTHPEKLEAYCSSS